MICPKCNSENVVVQREQSGSVGGSKTLYYRKHHGLIYFCLIGWWIWVFKIMFLPITMLFGRKKKFGSSSTINATKTINKTVAICQGCGHAWKV